MANLTDWENIAPGFEEEGEGQVSTRNVFDPAAYSGRVIGLWADGFRRWFPGLDRSLPRSCRRDF
jgi:hypothetical protein